MYKASRIICLVIFLLFLSFAAIPALGAAPDITCPDDMSAHNGGNVSSNYTVTDPDWDFITLTYRVDPPGPWLDDVQLHPAAGYAPFSGYVTYSAHCPYPGVYKIWLKAYDGTSYDSCYFQVTVYNNPPQITCPQDRSWHACSWFESTNLTIYDPDGDATTWTYLYTTPPPVNEPVMEQQHIDWQPTCVDLLTGPVFTFFLEATDKCGLKDTCRFQVTLTDQPPFINCPNDTSVHAGELFIGHRFIAYDPDGDPITVTLQSVSPTPTNTPTIVGNHVEWSTTCEDLVIGPNFTFALVVTDSCCGRADTCEFTVSVYNEPPVLTCPEDDSVHAGDNFVSTDFSVTDPEGDPVTVALCGITPAPTNQPSIVNSHVEWQTACADAGKIFTICLEATDSCGAKDSCYFNVTVYNRPPELTCPDDDTVNAGDTFVSSDFSVTDPDGETVSVTFLDITPPATHNPTIVGSHVEWVTTCAENGNYTIRLVATDPCGLRDTCEFQVTVMNEPPQITCPDSMTVHSGHYSSGNFTVTHPLGRLIVGIQGWVVPAGTGITNLTVFGGVGSPPTSGHVEFDADCSYPGVYFICLEATDSCGLKDTCCFQVRVTNLPPQIICPFNVSVVGAGHFVSSDFTASDPEGFPFTVTICGVSPIPTNMPYIVGNHVEWDIAPGDVGNVYTITLCVTDDCGATDECSFRVTVGEVTYGNKVIIPNRVYERFGYGHWDPPDSIVVDDFCYPYEGINPGDFFEIPIILKDFEPDVWIGGFELEIDFDYIDLTFYGAERGCLLDARYTDQDEIFWSWEYFTYRVLPCNCPCCKYKIELYGQAEMPDGPYRKGYCLQPGDQTMDSTFWCVDQAIYHRKNLPDTVVEVGATLAWLKFQVANNELLRDLKLPIVFEWEHKLSNDWPYHIIQDWDCAENTMSDCDGYVLYTSSDPMQYDPTVCPATEFNILTFVDGGVHICSPCTAFTCVRGDINMNDIAYEVADAILFARYFIYGINVFMIDRNSQICASDANADGRTLMLSDLIYLIRVITHDAVPFPKLGPSSDIANLIISDGKITVECASSVGGLLFEFDGSVNATLLNANMEILSNEGKVLVWSSAGNSINAGASQVLSVSGANLVSVIAVDREGRELATTITTKLAPTTFALHAAYPNPFNPATNLSFTLPTATPYSLNIYNVAGQLVRTYEGMGNVGLNVITWNGKDNAGNEVSSGVYFYKLIAGSFTATNKMVMMK